MYTTNCIVEKKYFYSTIFIIIFVVFRFLVGNQSQSTFMTNLAITIAWSQALIGKQEFQIPECIVVCISLRPQVTGEACLTYKYV